ncbi:hypothetical protein GUITHDRAFT_152857 [Guillardia theta CCMP2712]|uniref:Transcription factor Pcc1 n=1 Tax=Guillardia theta (strain CCMP2712) TaxID=905079 RepID=L1J891_GUITC|nr:hypothetical protein GUITHDRAFT_152857 [Guillardia theta CCMP2712]EKX44756.1 hypothetical protein GUITHDRAFT_152857 [Guillardia theta CCMP2712]|eukprot:XP_005831736.1 hypothetical protein GUITHDRAFT_152857 [Guillardia theta CCMP2712]
MSNVGVDMLPENMQHRCSLSVDYPDKEFAEMVSQALAVDEELHQDKVARQVSSDGKTLIAQFAACDARMLRVSVNSFFEALALATRTLDAF